MSLKVIKEKTKAAILKRIAAGEPEKDVANRYNLHVQTVRKIVRKAKKSAPPPAPPPPSPPPPPPAEPPPPAVDPEIVGQAPPREREGGAPSPEEVLETARDVTGDPPPEEEGGDPEGEEGDEEKGETTPEICDRPDSEIVQMGGTLTLGLPAEWTFLIIEVVKGVEVDLTPEQEEQCAGFTKRETALLEPAYPTIARGMRETLGGSEGIGAAVGIGVWLKAVAQRARLLLRVWKKASKDKEKEAQSGPSGT